MTVTSARPSGGALAVPAKMTSSIFELRSLEGPCSAITQASASTIFDFPDPFGPTTPVNPGSNLNVVNEENDLKPAIASVHTFKVITHFQ